MLVSLVPHPDSEKGAVSAIDVDIGRMGGHRLGLEFRIAANFRQLEWPRPPLPEARGDMFRDELWRHTCFEAFLKVEDAREYHEFNLSPSGEWAAYRFSAYREGMERARIRPPRVEADQHGFGPTRTVKAILPLGQLGALAAHEPWRIGLSAVVEERNGRRTFWALRHPPGKPDFHHADCFALQLAPARPA